MVSTAIITGWIKTSHIWTYLIIAVKLFGTGDGTISSLCIYT